MLSYRGIRSLAAIRKDSAKYAHMRENCVYNFNKGHQECVCQRGCGNKREDGQACLK